MNKMLLILFTILSFSLQAQVELSFDKLFIECEDQWVAFPMDDEGSHVFGFIYVDPEAGLTINSEGSFKYFDDGSLEVSRIKETNVKVRLTPNNTKVAIIPNAQLKALEVEEVPEWLHFYKTELNTAEVQYNRGFMYNAWNQCQEALPFLLKAKTINPDFEGLIVEIAYSYNCMGDYSKAIELLEEEIKKNPKDAYINKEFIFSVTKTQDIKKASTQYYKSKKEIKENPYNAENCFNIMQFYFKEGDKKNFKKWYKELKKLPIENENIKNYADLMKEKLGL